MTIALACGCGAALRLRDDLAGKKVRCSKCSKVLEVPAAKVALCVSCSGPMKAGDAACPSCGETQPGPRRSPKKPPPAPPSRLCAEVVVVCALLGVDILLSLPQFAQRGGAPFATGAILMDLLMLVGLLMRSTWGWWASLLLCLIRSLAVFYLSTTLPRSAGGLRTLMTGIAVAYALSALLLLIARGRGAYGPPPKRPA